MIRVEIEIRVSEKENKRCETIVLETDYPACIDLLPEVKRLKIKLISQVIAEREQHVGALQDGESVGAVERAVAEEDKVLALEAADG